ncbi:MAG: hemolysin family protein [Dysgonamonadaceae bacterium]|jgi:CBS domain containing-hemolysin-like protein|nr:hemolysin family protein [Dysgonamonadaceae bacterium]
MTIEHLVILILLFLLLAFFSTAEIAFVSSSKLVFEMEKRKDSFSVGILDVFRKNPTMFISAMRTGYNVALVVFGLCLVGLLIFPLQQAMGADVAILLCLSLTAVVFVFIAGKLLPGIVARSNPNVFLRFFSVPLLIAYLILYPIAKLFSGLVGLLMKLFRVKPSAETPTRQYGRDDLDYLIHKTIEESPQNTELDKEIMFFRNALEFSTVKVRDCIVPRTEIVALDVGASLETLLATFIETGLSKILIYKEDIDNIIGYIHSSEMFTKPDDWTTKINELSFIPENMTANKLMKSMLEEKKNIAVVVDEFGGTCGVITLEDLVEEIFGEIEDEHDTKTSVAKKLGADEYILSGRMEIDQVNERFQLSLPESDEYQTVAGYILNFYRNFPKVNEQIVIDRYTFRIIKMTNTKIELVKLKVNK